MSEFDQLLDHVGQLPLPDAAYYLWINKLRLDRFDPPSSPPTAKVDMNGTEAFRKAVVQAYRCVMHEHATAADGPTFDRMRRAHPNATVQKLKSAIRAAVKFDEDCVRYYSHNSPNFLDNATNAIELAKSKNPGFQEKTYQFAIGVLMQAMR
jgi:hypothetical protein